MLRVENTNLAGVFVLTPPLYKDKRGHFIESFNYKDFEEKVAKSLTFLQESEVFSVYGVIRGLHFQSPPNEQEKLIRVIQGEVLDVVVDIRKSSPTYGYHLSILLSSTNRKQLFVPIGFAHGYSILSEQATVLYKSSQLYNPASEFSINFDDPMLDVQWGILPEKRIISSKDKVSIGWNQFNSPFN